MTTASIPIRSSDPGNPIIGSRQAPTPPTPNNPTTGLLSTPANIDRPQNDPTLNQDPIQDEFTVGDDDLTLRIIKRRTESDQDRRMPDRMGISRIDMWERSGRRYLGDHWSQVGNNSWFRPTPAITVDGIEGNPILTDATFGQADGTRRNVINRTQNAVITSVQTQVAQPPRTRITPVESTGKIVWFLSPEAGQALFKVFQVNPQLAASFGLQAEQMVNPDPNNPDDGPTMPLTTQQSASLRARLTVPWIDPVTQQQQPAILHEQDLTKIDDASDSRRVQQVYDAIYDAAGGDFYMTENELYSNIYGHAPVLFQWDTQTNLPKYYNPHILHVYPDPLATRIEDMEYLILDAVISADKAKAVWPHMAKQIDQAAATGARSSADWLWSATLRNNNWTRRMLTITTMWERHQRVPMTPEEAQKCGAAKKTTVPVYAQDDGSEYMGDAHDLNGQCFTGLQHDATSQPLTPLEDRDMTLLPDGTPTDPSMANWPHTIGVRQVQMILEGKIIVENIRCPFADIPMAWNVNIPEPWCPYGQGEPVRSEDVQQIINRVVSILHAHARYYQHPMEIWPQSLLERMKKSGIANWAKPGRVIGMPDKEWAALAASRQTGVFALPPPIPDSMVKLLEMMLNEHDRISGNVGVLQGAAPSADSSGRAIGMLQATATGPMGFKAMYSEWRSDRIAMLTLDAMVKWMPEDQWRQLMSELPWPVVQTIIGRIKGKKWKIKTEIVNGRGYNRQLNHQEALALYMEGQPARLISREDAMMKMDLEDPPGMARQIDKENEEMGLGKPQVGAMVQQAGMAQQSQQPQTQQPQVGF